MSSDSGRKLHHSGGAPPPPEAEPLPCPRCESRNTKFCYYNNYNLSQPRHFCKGCRRYWTQGGALRNIPIGGGTRKNHAKRYRTSSASSTASSVSTTATSSASQDHHQQQRQTPITATPISCITTTTEPDPLLPIDLNSVSRGFTSLLNTQNPSFLALGGFGLGIGSGYEDMGIDIGRGAWPLGEISGGESTHHHSVHGNGGGASGVSASLGGPTWQLGDGVFGEPDCFAWPDLSISPPCKEVK